MTIEELRDHIAAIQESRERHGIQPAKEFSLTLFRPGPPTGKTISLGGHIGGPRGEIANAKQEEDGTWAIYAYFDIEKTLKWIRKIEEQNNGNA